MEKATTSVNVLADATVYCELHKSSSIDVAALRAEFRMSQKQFATFLGVSQSTIEAWEQGCRKPSGPARALLQRTSDELHRNAA